MDNQFLTTPMKNNSSKIHSARDLLQKDELIKGLELKNTKLRTQIIKIQNVIDESLRDQPEQKNKQRQSIMRSASQQDQATITKQLANAYKRIKMYEYQISKIQQSQVEKGSIHKVKQVQNVIKEKKVMTDRLKAKLQQQQKLINQNVKKLSNGNMQQQIEKKIKSLSDQIKFLRQKQKQQEGKDQIRQSNMKKQFQFIKRLQNQLLQMGMSPGQMQDIKTKAIKKLQPSSISESNVTKNIKQSQKQDTVQNQQIIQQKTIDNFRQVQNQIKLLQKMQLDYEKKMSQSEIDRQRATKHNSDSRDRLLEIQDQMQKLEKQILVQKGKVIPSNLKPLKPLRSVSSHQMTQQKEKKLHAKNISINKGTKTLAHILKHDQVGMTSEKGQRFTDRNIIGKKNLHTKIHSFTVFINSQTGAIGGLQATYNSKKGGQYVKKDRQMRQQQYKQQKLTCGQGQWIKSITGTLNQQDRLESLYMITNKGQSKRFGEPKTTKKSFSFDIGQQEVPVCIFGSLLVFKQVGKPQFSIVQHFGIQINEQHSNKIDDILAD